MRYLRTASIVLVVLGSSLAIARDGDPFRDAPPPVPKPAPPRAMPSAREPDIAAPPPRPSVFSPGLGARIAAAAQASGIGVPSIFDFREPDPHLPSSTVAYLGAWGPATWSVGGRKDMFIIEAISLDGTVRLTQAFSDCCNNAPHQYPAGIRYQRGRFSGGKITLQDTQTQTVFELEMQNGQLHGSARRRDGVTGQVLLTKIE